MFKNHARLWIRLRNSYAHPIPQPFQVLHVWVSEKRQNVLMRADPATLTPCLRQAGSPLPGCEGESNNVLFIAVSRPSGTKAIKPAQEDPLYSVISAKHSSTGTSLPPNWISMRNTRNSYYCTDLLRSFAQDTSFKRSRSLTERVCLCILYSLCRPEWWNGRHTGLKIRSRVKPT